MTDVLGQIGITGFADMLIMSFIIYSLIAWLKRTQARFILTGILIVGAVYLLSQHFNLVLTKQILQAFFAVILFAILIIFQKELRQLFEQVALWSFNPALKREQIQSEFQSNILIISQSLIDFANEKIGALVVLPAKDNIEGFLDGGTELNGELSEELIKSLFDPHSSGHDGAVIIENDKVTKFSCHLPLSQDFKQLQKRGTRHAAALGLAENTDALCLVVSEERGEISIATNGKLTKIPNDELNKYLEEYYTEIYPDISSVSWKDFFKKNYSDKAIAIAASVLLWFVFVHESRLVYKSFTVPVKNIVIPAEMKIDSVYPDNIKVVLTGSRKDFFFSDNDDIKVFIRLPDAAVGKNAVTISKTDVVVPKNLVLEKIQPESLSINLLKKEQPVRQNLKGGINNGTK
ncbi:MAG: TIGR00159 family protein [Candidatus Dadabacteria bacterium]|nr:TIGR00159 family protein [Candidatus Dadabacteria bacterium]NIT13343.1 TIGR00159 family protein [Candidatus Dadabacteria bacterium]